MITNFLSQREYILAPCNSLPSSETQFKMKSWARNSLIPANATWESVTAVKAGIGTESFQFASTTQQLLLKEHGAS